MSSQVVLGQAAAGGLDDAGNGLGDLTLVESRFTTFSDEAQGAGQAGVAENLAGMRGPSIDGQI